MKPERWQQVETIFQAALQREAANCAVFLEGACWNDAELRAEVESLLAAHVALSTFKLFSEWDWAGAGQELKRAQELEPDNLDAHYLSGYYLQAMGRADEAVSEIRRAHEIDPVWHLPNNDFGYALNLARRYDEALGARLAGPS